jgi:hypothetical protein
MGKVNAQLGSVKQQLEEASANWHTLHWVRESGSYSADISENAQANLRRAQAEPDPESKRGDLKAELLEHVLERRKQLCTLSVCST